MTPILPRFHRRQQELEARSSVDRAVREAVDVEVTAPRATLPGDTRRLRGIPVAGGACGTSPGTDPLAQLLRSDRPPR